MLELEKQTSKRLHAAPSIGRLRNTFYNNKTIWRLHVYSTNTVPQLCWLSVKTRNMLTWFERVNLFLLEKWDCTETKQTKQKSLFFHSIWRKRLKPRWKMSKRRGKWMPNSVEQFLFALYTWFNIVFHLINSNWSSRSPWPSKRCPTRYCQFNWRWKRSWFEQTVPWPSTETHKERSNAATTTKSSAQFHHEVVWSMRRFGQIYGEYIAISDMPCMDDESAQIKSNSQVGLRFNVIQQQHKKNATKINKY